MITTKKITQEVETIDTLTCNKCKRQIDHNNEEYITLDKRWGYWSKGKDGTSHESHICEDCYDKIVATFEIPPNVEEYIWGG